MDQPASASRARSRSRTPPAQKAATNNNNRSRSRSPGHSTDKPPTRRSRSRSPPRRPKNYSGFKWKQPKRGDDEREDDKGLSRGYRDHDRRDDHRRGGDRDRERDRGGDRRDRDRDRDRRDGDRHRGDRDRDRSRDRHRDRDRNRDRDRDSNRPRDSERKSRPAPAAQPVAAAPTGEPMILVTVNDRLGSKAQIPCMASDPVKVFKAMVASKIGRPAHEIMIKRQGERPFKDHLTLEDYGVSNGVQLDLELDTGD